MKTEPRVGDVYKLSTGEILRFDSLSENFCAQIYGLKGNWTDYYVDGPIENVGKLLESSERLGGGLTDHQEGTSLFPEGIQ